MLHHTDNLLSRAEHIAERMRLDLKAMDFRIEVKIAQVVVREFVGQPVPNTTYEPSHPDDCILDVLCYTHEYRPTPELFSVNA